MAASGGLLSLVRVISLTILPEPIGGVHRPWMHRVNPDVVPTQLGQSESRGRPRRSRRARSTCSAQPN
jgi:hypothetical protein